MDIAKFVGVKFVPQRLRLMNGFLCIGLTLFAERTPTKPPSLKDGNFRSFNGWAVAVRVPNDAYSDVSVQPVQTPPRQKS